MGLLTFRDLGFLHGPHITWVVIGWEVQHTSAWTASCCLTHFCRRLWTTLQTGSSSSLGTHDLYNKKTRGDRSKPIPQERSAHPLLLVFTRVPFDPVMLWSKGLGALHRRALQSDSLRLTMLLHQGAEVEMFSQSKSSNADDCHKGNTGNGEKREFHWAYWACSICSLDTATADVWARGEPPQPARRRETFDHTSRAGSVLRPRWGQHGRCPDSSKVFQTHLLHLLHYGVVHLHVVNCRWLSLCVIACCYLSPSCRCLFYSGVLLHVTDWSGCQMPGESLANQHQTVGIWGSCYRRIS